ncbi:hypothetical protein Lepto7375DRAFT_4125 [Leptolyngbya sp. PCC 7375]|nr:hypothetical protein Lepto7375DRAFT_4125 [Leptolyngbya sp. PCC 7375]
MDACLKPAITGIQSLYSIFQIQTFKIHSFTLMIPVHSDKQLTIYVPEISSMDSKKSLLGLANNDQNHGQSQSSSEPNQDNTMSLVYPDGRVKNVKVRQK